MTTQQRAQKGPQYPMVGDLVAHGAYQYVVSDIVGRKSDNPCWEMRPVHGGQSKKVRKDTIQQWPVKARRGTWMP